MGLGRNMSELENEGSYQQHSAIERKRASISAEECGTSGEESEKKTNSVTVQRFP